MNLDGAREKVKIKLPCSFFHFLLFLCLLLCALSKDPVLEKGLADHRICNYAFSFPKLSEFFCCSIHNCLSELVFPEALSLETLNTILGSSVGNGLQSEGWSS